MVTIGALPRMNERLVAYTRRDCSTAAPMKEAKSGCGSHRAGREPREAQARGFELVAVAHVHLVAVAVTLGDVGRAVDLGDIAALGEHGLVGAEPHRAAEIAVRLAQLQLVALHPFGHQSNHRLAGRAELGRTRPPDPCLTRAVDPRHL